MEVQHYDRARYLVTCHGETFTVDLLRYDGNGQCDCFQFIGGGRPPRRRQGLREQIECAIAAGTFVPGPQFRCPHIAAARDAMLDLFLLQLRKQFPNELES